MFDTWVFVPRGVPCVFFVFFVFFECRALLREERLGVRLRVSLLAFLLLLELLLHHLREVFREEGAVLARPLDVRDVVLIPVVLLHQLRRRGRDLDLVVGGDGGRCGSRDQRLDILEKNLAVLTGAGDGLDVDAVVPRELLRARGSVDLLLGGLGEGLEVLHRDLVVGSSALEVVRNGDALRFREVLGRLAREPRGLLLLGGLQKFLREETLCGQEEQRGGAVGGLVREHLVDDHREVLRGGRHRFGVVRGDCCVHPPYAARL
jgi:hypothetical protein